MLSIKARILIVAGLLLLLGVIINMVRKRRLELKYVLAWLIADLALIFFTIFPQTMMGLAQMLGIYSPVNMIFFLGFVFLALIIFSLTVALSRATANQRRLAQSAALREYEEYRRNCPAVKEDQHHISNGVTTSGTSGQISNGVTTSGTSGQISNGVTASGTSGQISNGVTASGSTGQISNGGADYGSSEQIQ